MRFRVAILYIAFVDWLGEIFQRLCGGVFGLECLLGAKPVRRVNTDSSDKRILFCLSAQSRRSGRAFRFITFE